LGYSFSGVATGCEALEFIRQGRKATVVITGIIMPQMNGYEFATQLRQIRPEIKLLFTLDSRLHRHPTIPFLAKPFILCELQLRTREINLSLPAKIKAN
jgi:CheY-like chemotaxis protein